VLFNIGENRNGARTWSKHDFANGNVFGDPLTQKTNFTLEYSIMPENLKIYYRWVLYRIIAKRIESSLSPSSWKVLFGKRKHFTWIGVDGVSSFDGPRMLKLIIMTINPSTRVGILDLKSDIQNACLWQFQWNVTDTCDKMMGCYLIIGEINASEFWRC